MVGSSLKAAASDGARKLWRMGERRFFRGVAAAIAYCVYCNIRFRNLYHISLGFCLYKL